MCKKTVFFATFLLALHCFSPVYAVMIPFKVDADVYKLMIEKEYISKDDIKTYKNIFRAIKAEDIEEADELTKDLQNDLLLGHVLAEKYLSKSYKSNYEELKKWLEKYGDYPQAFRIYRLAASKGSKANLPDPEQIRADSYNKPLSARNFKAYENLSSGDRAFVQKRVTQFYKYLSSGKTRAARLILENKRFRMAIPNKYWDEMSTALANSYFLDNYDQLAFQWAQKPAKRSHIATAYWVAGLASWRMNKYQTAADYFSQLGKIRDNDEWLEAAGAFWAYRSYMRLGKSKPAEKELEAAARYQRTFYGILAAKILGRELTYNWDGVAYRNDFSTPAYAENLVKSTSIRRAVALLHAKRPELAEAELRSGYESMSDEQKEAMLFMLGRYDLHGLVIKISNDLKDYDKGIYYDCLAYPVPQWIGDNYADNQALLLALTRQESSFDPRAVSPVGACGLMQLMPNTAFHVTGDRKVKKNREMLFDIDYNLATGQKYVNYLMSKAFIDGNLFFMLTAYNAGPGNLVKWQKKMKYNNDPLLFIETIPARQTRIYIERVMANYWIYSMLLGQEPESVVQLSSGLWPTSGRSMGN